MLVFILTNNKFSYQTIKVTMKVNLLILCIIIPILVNCDRFLSSDSSELELYKIFYGSNDKIYVMNEDGSDKKCITDFIDPIQFESAGFADLHQKEEKILFDYVNYETETKFKTGIMNLDGSDHQIFDNAKYRPLRPVLSNDGTLILFSASGDSSGLYQMAIDGSNIVCLSDSGESISFIKKVAGTNDIIYIKRSGNKYDIYRRNLDNNNEIQVTQKGDLYHYNFAISANGDLIVYSSSNSLYMMNSDGTENKQILNIRIAAPPAISRGDKVAYVIMSGNGFEIRIIDSNGENQKILATTGRPYDNDYWRPNILFSPDGEKLFYTGCQDNYFNIHTVEIDGENLTNITNSSEDEFLFDLYYK